MKRGEPPLTTTSLHAWPSNVFVAPEAVLYDDDGEVVGPEHVLTDPDVTVSYATDWTGRFRGEAMLVVRPADSDQVAAVLRQYASEGFAPFAAEWQHRHAYQGKMVRLLLPDGATVTGKVAGVDASGALVLADGPRRARFLSGEISLRRAG